MKLEKISIDIEKLGKVEIFSYGGYILGYRNKTYTDSISYFPIVINKDKPDVSFLNIYLNFVDEATQYSRGDDYYPPRYDVYFKEYNKIYKDRSRHDIVDLLNLSLDTTDVAIIPEETVEMGDFVRDLLKEISLLDDKIDFGYSYDENKKVFINSLSIYSVDYIEVEIDYFENLSVNYNYVIYEKDIKEIMKILNHMLEMLDKNLGSRS